MPAVFPEPPLSAAALALTEQILAIPVTFEPIVDDLPEELANGRMGALYDAVNEGDLRVAPELKKLIARHPGYPTLQNYLRCLYQVADKPRQAEQVLKELERCHPEYLFTRLAFAERALERGKFDQVREALGQQLDLRALYPERTIFHISEIRNYYLHVGIYHARVGDMEAAHGVRAALEQLEPGGHVTGVLLGEILRAGQKRMQERFRRDEAKRISVKIPRLSHRPTGAKAPRFEHPEMDLLYRHDTEIPLARLREILALPRESLVRDLVRVLEDAVLRTPDFMAGDAPEEGVCAPFHALHLLAELRATEALEAVLRFFELHPDALDFWLADGEFAAPLSRLVGDDLPRCVDWLKSPGIHADGKFHIANGMNRLALVEPERKAEVAGCLEEVFRFVLESPSSANVLDTHFLSFLAGDLLDLRVVSALPALTEAWEKEYLEETMLGDLATITEQMAEPESPAPKPFALTEVYRQSGSPYAGSRPAGLFEDLAGDWEDEDESVQESGFEPVPIGRNDPCPCGSGKKYKKCCIN